MRLGVGAGAVFFLLPLVASATPELRARASVSDAYVIAETDGRAMCREATEAEALAISRRPTVPMMVFGEGRRSIASDESSAGHLNIILRGTAQLEANAAAKAAFERAAAVWESRIRNPITIYVDVDFGEKRFGEAWSSSSVIASAGTPSYIFADGDFGGFRPLFVSRADNAQELEVYNALPLDSFPTDAGSVSAFGGGANILRTFGMAQFPPLAAPDDPASTIGFNSAFSYDFDPSDGIDAGKKDFVGVVVHEIGHMLGFSSRVGVKETNANAKEAPAVLDFFRFRPGVTLASFSTAERVLRTGGDQVFFGGVAEHALSTGNPKGENGDNQQASHWKDDGQTGTYIGVMDPTIPSARRVELTRYDIEAFGMLGWDLVTPGGCAELEPNDRLEDGTEPVFNVPCTGTVGLSDASAVNFKLNNVTTFVQDFFKIVLPGEAKLHVTLSGTNSGANLNMVLVRQDLSIIASSTGATSAENFETATLGAGTYYLGVYSLLGTSTYTVQVDPIGLIPAPPSAPVALVAVPASATAVHLTWADTANNETEFRIEEKQGASFVDVGSAAANATSFDVTGLAANTAYTFRLRARNQGGDSAYTAEGTATTLVEPGVCLPTATTVCLLSGRFRVKIDYLNQFANPPVPGTFAAARLSATSQNPDTATFGFASATAVEVVVRIQDARPFGIERFDVYYGGLTDVEYGVTVQDMQTGTTRQYHNPPAMVGGGVDRTSFPANGAPTPAYRLIQGTSTTRSPVVVVNSATGACVADATTVCLLSNRFKVKIGYLNQFANPPSPGQFVTARLLSGPQNPDVGLFGFSSPTAIEVVVRIQDARPFAPRFDIYYGGLTDVEYTMTVTDMQSGITRQYRNPPGSVGGGLDRASFPAN